MTSAGEEQRLRDLARLRRVRDRIDREYAQPLNVEALAREAQMSAGHLSRQFKSAYGESLLQACATRLGERTMTAVAPLAEPVHLDISALTQLAVRAVRAWIADGGVLVLARHELLLESAQHPQMRSVLDAATDHIRGLLERRLIALGISDAAERTGDLIACLDGIALAYAVRGVTAEDALRRSVTRVVSGLLAVRD
ncbi:Putative transcriptional regulator, TetR family [Mycobacteroides abscessus subsp. abscessus]|nr:Putative transcriptional regulator, TetR family [Mycobacteroides abscessus subsp. abscessus]